MSSPLSLLHAEAMRGPVVRPPGFREDPAAVLAEVIRCINVYKNRATISSMSNLQTTDAGLAFCISAPIRGMVDTNTINQFDIAFSNMSSALRGITSRTPAESRIRPIIYRITTGGGAF